MTVVLGIIQLKVAAALAASVSEAAAAPATAAVIIRIISTSSIAIAQTVDHVAVQRWFSAIGENISSLNSLYWTGVNALMYAPILSYLFNNII